MPYLTWNNHAFITVQIESTTNPLELSFEKSRSLLRIVVLKIQNKFKHLVTFVVLVAKIYWFSIFVSVTIKRSIEYDWFIVSFKVTYYVTMISIYYNPHVGTRNLLFAFVHSGPLSHYFLFLAIRRQGQ